MPKSPGILNGLLNDWPSGWNEKQAIDEALHKYNDELKTSFKYMAGYNLFIENVLNFCISKSKQNINQGSPNS